MKSIIVFLMLLVSSPFAAFSADRKGDLADFGVKAGDPAFDNGAIINRAAKSVLELYLPEGTYYFKTPIELKNLRSIHFLGNLVYTGNNGVSAITITGNNVSVNLVGYVSGQKEKISYAKYDEDKATVGVDFVNMNNSTVFINEVRYFNENVRVSGLGAGCSYNKFSIGMIRNANVGLRIYQRDEGGKRGWANENTFIGGRFCNYADWNKAWPTLAIRIAGPDKRADAYHIANSLLFLKQSFENYDTVVYARNVRESDFLYARLEGSKVFVQFAGSSRTNRVSCDYQGSCKLYSDDESNTIPVRMSEVPVYPVAMANVKNGTRTVAAAGGNVYLADGFGFAPSSNLLAASQPSITEAERRSGFLPSIDVNTSVIKVYRVVMNKPGKVYISYLEGGRGAAAPKTDITDSFSAEKTSGVFSMDVKKDYLYFQVPSGVTKIRVSMPASVEYFQILSRGAMAPAEIPQVKASGASKDRPKAGYPGQMFYDETLRRYIFWNGEAWTGFDGSKV